MISLTDDRGNISTVGAVDEPHRWNMSCPLIPGDRVGYRTLTGDSAPGTVTATGWELSGEWVEIKRDSDPAGPPIRLSVQASQVARIDTL